MLTSRYTSLHMNDRIFKKKHVCSLHARTKNNYSNSFLRNKIIIKLTKNTSFLSTHVQRRQSTSIDVKVHESCILMYYDVKVHEIMRSLVMNFLSCLCFFLSCMQATCVKSHTCRRQST